MNITIVARNTLRRPSLSEIQPPATAPSSAPPCTAAEARPSIEELGWKSFLMKIRTKEIA